MDLFTVAEIRPETASEVIETKTTETEDDFIISEYMGYEKEEDDHSFSDLVDYVLNTVQMLKGFND